MPTFPIVLGVGFSNEGNIIEREERKRDSILKRVQRVNGLDTQVGIFLGQLHVPLGFVIAPGKVVEDQG